MPAATGVIGVPLPIKPFEDSMPALVSALSDEGSKIVKKINDGQGLKIINKKSLYKPTDEVNKRLWEIDKLSTDLYNQLIYDHINIRLHSELTSSVRGLKNKEEK